MRLAPFLLDQWLDQKFTADPPIDFDLGSSTGPIWTVRELLALEGGGVPDEVLDAAVSYTSPRGSAELREEIARMHGVDPEHIQVTTGAAEALLALFYLAAESDANVVLPNPAFPTNEALAESLGIQIRRYTLRADNGFRVDPDEVRRLVDRNTRFVLVNSPHNPTGAVLSDVDMERLHDFCAGRGVAFVSDEVYHPIYHGPETRSAARLPHATVLSDFSKALCLSGLRVGWIVERDAARREAFTNARSYFTVSNTVLGEKLAALALRHRDAIYGRARQVAQANLALLDRLFTEHPGTLRWVRPSGGMTAFPWLANGGDGREFCSAAMRRGVLLAPGDCFGMPGHYRLGFAASGEQFAKGLERLAETMREQPMRRSGTWGA
jgi:aspartate/methionine/tyrosine aminotransferase